MFGKKKNKKALNQQDTHDVADTEPSEVSEPVIPKKAKADSKKKKKGFSLFGSRRSKEPIRITDAMQLEESVATSAIDVLTGITEEHVPSAVRYIDGEGFIIIALTNEQLETFNLDVKSEVFGSFAEGLRNETIESITLPKDIERGVIGLIPTLDTLQALEEFEFLDNAQYHYALVPEDMTDDDGILLLNNTVIFDDLLTYANDFNLQYELQDMEVVVFSTEGRNQDEDVEEPNYMTEEEVQTFIDPKPEPLVFEDDEDDSISFIDDMDTMQDEHTMDAMDDTIPTYSFPEDDADMVDDMDSFTTEDVVEMDEETMGTSFVPTDLTEEEASEQVRQLTLQIKDTELGLELTTEKFDDYFANQRVVNFEIVDDQGNELQRTLNEMRRDANSELERIHQDGVQSLRQYFISSIRQAYEVVQQNLDVTDESSRYYEAYEAIKSRFNDTMNRRSDIEHQRSKEIRADYDARLQAYVENAKRLAEASFERIYGDEHRRTLQQVSQLVVEEIQVERDASFAELHTDRRMVASNMFERIITTLLRELTQQFNTLAEKEMSVYDGFRQNMEIYLRKHYSDEVLRAKAEAEKLRQMHEAERVREEYDQMLLTKTRMLEEQEATYHEKLQKMDAEHRMRIEEVRAEMNRMVERERQDNDTLRESVRQANQSNALIGEQKDKEIEHRMKTLENMLEAKDAEIRYVTERAERNERPMKFIMSSIGAVALAAGILFGFLFGASNTAKQVSVEPQPTTQQQVSNETAQPNTDASSDSAQ